jgi:hypothetical protein
MTITGDGKVGIGTTSPQGYTLHVKANSSDATLVGAIFETGSSKGWSVNNSAMYVGKTTTNRSINAGGTFNANGADYAEYMTKNENFVLNKGDICCIDANGLLTNKYSESKMFVIKSTNPSYVGGDVWGTEEKLNMKKPEMPSDISSNSISYQIYDASMVIFQSLLEANREKVDRIAFCGQVPVNVYGANPGDYIVPICLENDIISGINIPETNITFQDYMKAIGKVICINNDGRAECIVKIL